MQKLVCAGAWEHLFNELSIKFWIKKKTCFNKALIKPRGAYRENMKARVSCLRPALALFDQVSMRSEARNTAVLVDSREIFWDCPLPPPQVPFRFNLVCDCESVWGSERVRCWGEAAARKGGPSGTRDKGGVRHLGRGTPATGSRLSRATG